MKIKTNKSQERGHIKQLNQEDRSIPSIGELERRERRLRNLVGLEELISWNKRVDDSENGRHQSGGQGQIKLDSQAWGGILRLMAGNAIAHAELTNNTPRLPYLKLIVEMENKYQKGMEVIKRIARIMSQSYADVGCDSPLDDVEALEMIRDLLLDYDHTLIDRERRQGSALVTMIIERRKRNV